MYLLSIIVAGFFTGVVYLILNVFVHTFLGLFVELTFSKVWAIALTVIVTVLIIGFSADASVELDLSFGTLSITTIIVSYIAFRFMRGDSVVCPHCGAWNEYVVVKHLGESTNEVWRTHDRAIRNSDYQKIGTYESRELHTYKTSHKNLRCTSCGQTFSQDFTYEV